MGFRKLNIAVDCKDDLEQQEVQKILDRFSNILRLNGQEVILNAPIFEKNIGVIREIISTMKEKGLNKGILSILPLIMKFKK